MASELALKCLFLGILCASIVTNIYFALLDNQKEDIL
jgi:hypothetical protein